MKASILAAAVVTLFSLHDVRAQEVTNPIHYTWMATSCENWNCAAAALILADGEPNVIVLPTSVEKTPWLVLRRVEEGSIYIPETEAFSCQVFEQMTSATSAYGLMDGCRKPLMLSVPDGRSVVVSLKQCDGARRRAAQ